MLSSPLWYIRLLFCGLGGDSDLGIVAGCILVSTKWLFGLLLEPWEDGEVRRGLLEESNGWVRWLIIGFGFEFTWGLFNICGIVWISCWADPFVRRCDMAAEFIKLVFMELFDVGGAEGGGCTKKYQFVYYT